MIIFTFTPFFQVVKSYTIMSVYSKKHEINSFIKDMGISIHMPGGLSTLKKDYYPFVMTYDTSDEFSEYLNMNIDLIILYNFGAMEWLKGSSLMYNESSPYYSSFYGAYIAKNNGISRQFGTQDNGNINIKEIMEVTNFDLKTLVLRSIGNESPEIEYEVVNIENPYQRIIDGISFDVYDVDINMDGMNHVFVKDYTAYIQYGRPVNKEGLIESFKKINNFGRIYVYFDYNTKVSYFFYIIAPSSKIIEDTEENFILPADIIGITP